MPLAMRSKSAVGSSGSSCARLRGRQTCRSVQQQRRWSAWQPSSPQGTQETRSLAHRTCACFEAPVLNVVVWNRFKSCLKPSVCFRNLGDGTLLRKPHYFKVLFNRRGYPMGRYLLLWLLGIPIPILLLIWAFGGLP